MMKKETFWTAIALTARSIGQLLLTFTVVTQLDKTTASLWFVFMSLWAMVQFLDVGFSAAVLRAASYLWAGLKELTAQGLTLGDKSSEPNIPKLKDLLATVNVAYALLAAVVVTLGGILALTFMAPFLHDGHTHLAWLLFCVAAAVQLMLSQRYNYLQGVGRLVLAQQLCAICAFFGLGITALSLWLSHSLLLGCGVMAAAWIIQLLVFDFALEPLSGGRFCFRTLEALWPNSWRSGVSRLCWAAVYHLPALILSRIQGVIIGGQYGFTVQVCLFISALAQIPVVAIIPRLHELTAAHDLAAARKLFFARMRLMLVSHGVLALVLLFVGSTILSFIHSKTSLLPLAILIPTVIFFIVENHRNNFVTLVSAFNQFPFWKYDLLGALAVVGGVWLLAVPMGVGGVILWMWLVHVAWNFWWPVREGLKKLDSRWSEYCASLLLFP